jgi:hypothetical protein
MVATVVPAARAGATELSVACARLDPDAGEELRARLRLTLRTQPRSPSALIVACDDARAWVIWDGPPLEMLPVVPDGELREAVLDVVESRLRELGNPSAPAQKPGPQKPGPNELPSWEPREPPELPRGPRPPTGGFGTGLAVEPLADPYGTVVGPRLDIGIGWAPFNFVIWESPRFGQRTGGYDVFLFTLESGIAWGAPYVPGHWFGAALTGGVEWFSLGGETQATGAATLGLRAAVPAGPLWLWLGADGHTRFSPPAADDAIGGSLPRYSAMITLGVMLTVEVPVGPRR